MKKLYPDTNVALHFRRFDEVDWLKLTGDTEVAIVLTPQFVSELDKLKRFAPTNRVRDRARDFTTWLNQWEDRGEKPIRASVAMEILDRSPGTIIDFKQHELDANEADDRHIAAMIMQRAAQPDDVHVLVTADRGIRRKAKQRGVEVLAPHPDDALKDEPDEKDKEIEKLRREVAKAQSARPDLTLAFRDGSTKLDVRVLQPSNIAAAIDKRRRSSEFNFESLKEIWRSHGRGTEEWAVAWRRIRRWLELCARVRLHNANLIVIDLVLHNAGSAPAMDVEVLFEVAAPHWLHAHYPLDEPSLKAAMESPAMLADDEVRLPPPTTLGPLRVNAIGRTGRLHCGDLKHNDHLTPGRFFVLLDDFTEQGFSLSYRILSSAPGDAPRKKLHIVPIVIPTEFEPEEFDVSTAVLFER